MMAVASPPFHTHIESPDRYFRRAPLGLLQAYSTRHRAIVVDDLTVAGPDEAYGLWRAYAGTPRVPGRPKPVVLGRTCRAGQGAGFGQGRMQGGG